MRTLICGSIAYDTIMVFRDRFKNHILPEQLHILNVAFLVPDLRREFGGCAGNIGYNLGLLGGEPLIMATVGDDYLPYDERLKKLQLSQQHVRRISGTFTAQAFITTDLDDNQITAFHPGAMNHSHDNHVADASGVKLGIVAPDGRDGMLQHAREFHAAGHGANAAARAFDLHLPHAVHHAQAHGLLAPRLVPRVIVSTHAGGAGA